MQDRLTIPISDELLTFLEADAAARGVSVEDIGRFALDLYVHFSAEIRSAHALVLQAPTSNEPTHNVLYATTVAPPTSVDLDTPPGAAVPRTYLMSVSPGKPPRLRVVR